MVQPIKVIYEKHHLEESVMRYGLIPITMLPALFLYLIHKSLPQVNNNTVIFNTTEIVNQVNEAINLTQPIVSSTKNIGYQPYQHALNKRIPENELRNKNLRIIVPAIEPPYVNYVNFSDAAPNDVGYGPGIVIEILKEIAEMLNLTYTIINETASYTQRENGTWNKAFSELVHKDVDIIAGAAIMDYSRSLITDLTYPFKYEMTGMLIRSPDKYEDRTMLIVTAPFKWQVWVTTAGAIIVSAGVLLLISRAVRVVYGELTYGYGECLWIFYSIFVQQGLFNQPKSWSCRVLIALWWLASITLMATFTGSLVALFAVEKMALPFQDIDGLVAVVKQGKYRLLMDGNSRTRTEMIARSDLPVYKQLWYEISVNHKVLYVNGYANAVEILHNNTGYVLLGPWETLKYYAYVDCHFYLLEDGILPAYLSIPLQFNSPYSTYFSSRIRGMDERGFIIKWMNDYNNYVYSQRWNVCNTTTPKNMGYLDLKRAQGAFWILLGGLALAAVLLVAELGIRWLVVQIGSWWFLSPISKESRSEDSPSSSESIQNTSEDSSTREQSEESTSLSVRRRNPHRRTPSPAPTYDFVEIEV